MSEIGVVGQVYEDRRTKKKGKLVSRDEKFKTLLMESEDGKSFNISYGGFKSNWRSIDVPVETIEEAMKEVEVPEEKPKEKPKTKKVKVAKTPVSETLEGYLTVFETFIRSFNSDKMSLNIMMERKSARKSPYVTVKIGNSAIATLYLRTSGYFRVIMQEVVYSHVKWSVKFPKVVSNNKNVNCRLMCEDLGRFLEDTRPFIVEVLSASVVEVEEE